MTLNEALEALNPKHDDHWTADGMPRMDALHALLGHEDVTRADVTNAAPDFTREKAREAAELKEHADAEPEAEAPVEAEGATSEAEAEPATEEEAPVGDDDDGPAPDEADEADEDPPAGPEVSVKRPFLKQPSPIAETIKPEMTPQEYVNTLPNEIEALEEAQRELGLAMLAAQGEQKEAKVNADRFADAVNAVNRRLEVMKREDPNHGTKSIRDYIKSQNQARIQRATGVRTFLRDVGVNAKDLSNALDPRSPIDRAMGLRKPGRGTKRPAYVRQP